MVQKQRTSDVNDISAALEGENEYTPALTRMEGTEDEANQVTESGATAVTRSELDMWEAARASDSTTSITNALQQEIQESELTEDTVRMYLREIGRVALLTAADEVVLARAVRRFRGRHSLPLCGSTYGGLLAHTVIIRPGGDSLPLRACAGRVILALAIVVRAGQELLAHVAGGGDGSS